MSLQYSISNKEYSMQDGTACIKLAYISDGVVNIQSALWSSDDSFDNDPNNSYFNDLGEDGGYNHFELRHYERPYTLPGIFIKGEINPPMQRLREWINGGYEIDSNN